MYWLIAMVLLAIPSLAHPWSIEWDRNPDTDQVEFYSVYLCQTKGCPDSALVKLTDKIPQPPAGVNPKWTIPAGISGRVAVSASNRITPAQDLYQESGLSVSLPFVVTPVGIGALRVKQ